MLSESRKKKLQMLTKSLAAGDVRRAQEILRAVEAGGPPDGKGHPAGPGGQPAVGQPVELTAAAPGREVRRTEGRYWLVGRPLGEVSGDSAALQSRYAAILRGARQRFDELGASAGLCHVANSTPEGPLFLDIETCGLVGSCIFLVGLMSFQDGGFVFDQFLARHYGEEPAILAAFADRLAAASVIVTFNGKTFDMTNLRERSVFHGLDLRREPAHCDLLHESRRQWRAVVPNCRLQTLEQYLCRRRRVGDIASAEIPEVYHQFVADGDARRLGSVLHHNLLDLLTMAELLCLLLTGEQPNPA